jgi:uncharacterized protein YqjF (DUF2071 family)
MTQEWRNLLFAHYSIKPALLLPHLPDGLIPDVFPDASGELKAWIGFVPFEIWRLRWPGSRVSLSFLETNVRTYVRRENVPGVWFFSLDAASLLAVRGARLGYSLPYWKARLSCTEDGDLRTYEGVRSTSSRPDYQGRFVLGDELPEPQPGSLKFFLVERYLLFSLHKGRLHTGRVHHSPYSLRSVKLLALDETMTVEANLPQAPYAHFVWSAGVDVEVFPLTRAT